MRWPVKRKHRLWEKEKPTIRKGKFLIFCLPSWSAWHCLTSTVILIGILRGIKWGSDYFPLPASFGFTLYWIGKRSRWPHNYGRVGRLPGWRLPGWRMSGLALWYLALPSTSRTPVRILSCALPGLGFKSLLDWAGFPRNSSRLDTVIKVAFLFFRVLSFANIQNKYKQVEWLRFMCM